MSNPKADLRQKIREAGGNFLVVRTVFPHLPTVIASFNFSA